MTSDFRIPKQRLPTNPYVNTSKYAARAALYSVPDALRNRYLLMGEQQGMTSGIQSSGRDPYVVDQIRSTCETRCAAFQRRSTRQGSAQFGSNFRACISRRPPPERSAAVALTCPLWSKKLRQRCDSSASATVPPGGECQGGYRAQNFFLCSRCATASVCLRSRAERKRRRTRGSDQANQEAEQAQEPTTTNKKQAPHGCHDKPLLLPPSEKVRRYSCSIPPHGQQ